MGGRSTLLPFLYFVPLRPGATVLVVSRPGARDAEEPGLLDVRLVSEVPDGAAADAVIADVRDPSDLAAARRAAGAAAPSASVLLLDWRASLARGLRDGWRLMRGGAPIPPFPIPGRIARREFLVDPGLARPRHLVQAGALDAVPEGHGPPWRRMLRRGGLYFLAPRHRAAVFAPPEVPDVLGEALGEVLPGPAAVRRVYVSDTETMVVRAEGGGRASFVRFPFGERSLERVSTNHRITAVLRGRGLAIAPPPLALRTGGIAPYQAEGALPGRPAEPVGDADAARLLSAALGALLPVHEAFGRRVTIDDDAFRLHVGERLAAVERSAGRSLEPVARRLAAALGGRRLLVTLCHGDFKLGNCLFEGSHPSGIVDWDMGSESDLALLDVGNAIGKAMQGDRPLWEAASRAIPPAIGEAYAGAVLPRDADPVPLRDALLLWWLDRAYKQVRFGSDPDGSWVRRHVLPMLERA